MRRRDFIAAVGGAAAAWPLAARAQQGERVRRVGMRRGADESDFQKERVSLFTATLAEAGWIDGRNLRLDVRWAAGDPGRMRTFAKELVDLKPDVLVAQTPAATKALQAVTQGIPIVFIGVGDPVAGGLLKNIARPEGNTTGATNYLPSFGGKWLELLKEAAPRVVRVGLLFNPELQFSRTYFPSIEAAASQLAVRVVRIPYRSPAELGDGADSIAAEPNGGVIILPPVGAYPPDFFLRLQQNRLPAIAGARAGLTAGVLMFYGADNTDLFRRAASYVDRILHGEKPGDLPVQFPIKFEMVLNLKVAKAIGITFQASLIALADKVIE